MKILALLAELPPEQRRAALLGLGVAAVLVDAGSRHMPLKGAAARAGVSLSTMTRWTERFGLGRRVGGRWRIDGERFDAFLAERPL